MKLQGKLIVVTGASSGIGLELTKLLLDEGATVWAVALDASLMAIEDPLIRVHDCDLGTGGATDALFRAVIEREGRPPDVFVANAGFGYYERIAEADWPHADRIFQVNALAPIYAAEKMKQIHGARPFTVLITASAMSWVSLAGYALYSATKAALRGFTDAYRYELGPGQRLILTYPVSVPTRFFERAGTRTLPWPRQSARRVARRMLQAIVGRRNEIYPGPAKALLLVGRWPLLPFTLYQARLARRLRTNR